MLSELISWIAKLASLQISSTCSKLNSAFNNSLALGKIYYPICSVAKITTLCQKTFSNIFYFSRRSSTKHFTSRWLICCTWIIHKQHQTEKKDFYTKSFYQKKNSFQYLELKLENFPNCVEHFHRTRDSRIGFLLSNVAYKLPFPWGTFYWQVSAL